MKTTKQSTVYLARLQSRDLSEDDFGDLSLERSKWISIQSGLRNATAKDAIDFADATGCDAGDAMTACVNIATERRTKERDRLIARTGKR